MAMRLAAGPLSARLRATRSATCEGLRLLGGGQGIDASSSLCSPAPSSRHSYSSGDEGDFPYGYPFGKLPGHFPRIIYPQGFKAAEESERFDRVMDRLENTLDRKEGVTVFANYNIGQKPQDWNTTLESALAWQRREFDAALASQKAYYVEKLSDAKKELNDKLIERKEFDAALATHKTYHEEKVI